MDLWIKGTEPRQGAGGFGGETAAKGSGMSMCLSFYSERKKYHDESAPIIECGGMGVTVISPWRIITQRMCGVEKISGPTLTTHTQSAL